MILGIVTCSGDAYLRGKVEPSNDGLTYLMIADDGNGTCKSVLLDGKVWPYKTGEVGKVSPGIHKIDCNGIIEFDIPEGVVFKFDYWGP